MTCTATGPLGDRAAVTGNGGKAELRGLTPGKYRVRAEMIGMATGETEPFDVATGATTRREVRMESSAIRPRS